MSKPFMFHFAAKIIYIFFYSRNFFRNFFLKKAKISPRKQNFRFYVIKHIFIAQEQKTPKAGRLSELIFSKAQSLRND